MVVFVGRRRRGICKQGREGRDKGQRRGQVERRRDVGDNGRNNRNLINGRDVF